MDFIVKPYTYEVFQFRMDRVVHRVERKKMQSRVLLTSNDQVYRVLLSELLYVEVAAAYAHLPYRTGRNCCAR